VKVTPLAPGGVCPDRSETRAVGFGLEYSGKHSVIVYFWALLISAGALATTSATPAARRSQAVRAP
jgi:hypothetical protein